MRGKQAASAAARRDWSGVTVRAERAERERDQARGEVSRLTAELSAQREATARLDRDLRQQITDVTGPRVAELERANELLITERDTAVKWVDDTQNVIQPKLMRLLELAYQRLGLDPNLAWETAAVILKRNPDTMVIRRTHPTAPISHQAARVLEGQTASQVALRDELVAEALADPELAAVADGKVAER